MPIDVAAEGSNSFYTSSNLAARQAEGEEQEPKADQSPNADETNPEASKGSPAAEEEAEETETGPRKKRKVSSINTRSWRLLS